MPRLHSLWEISIRTKQRVQGKCKVNSFLGCISFISLCPKKSITRKKSSKQIVTLRASIYKFIFNCRRQLVIRRPLRNQNTRKTNCLSYPPILVSIWVQLWPSNSTWKNNHIPFILQAPPLVHLRIHPIAPGKVATEHIVDGDWHFV